MSECLTRILTVQSYSIRFSQVNRTSSIYYGKFKACVASPMPLTIWYALKHVCPFCEHNWNLLKHVFGLYASTLLQCDTLQPGNESVIFFRYIIHN